MTHDEYQDIAALEALGVASSDEQLALHGHLASCDECRRALDQYIEAAAAIGADVPSAVPPPDVRARILAAIRPNEEALFDAARRRPMASHWWLATAATMFLALWGWREIGIRVAREHLHSVNAELLELQGNVARLRQQNRKLATDVATLTAGDTQTIALVGQKIAPEASARVFLRPAERRAIVFFHSLPDNAGDKSYQLWIIRADQANPQSAGVFDVDAKGDASIVISNLPLDTEIKGLAVTLEPRGGVEQPTNTDFYLKSS